MKKNSDNKNKKPKADKPDTTSKTAETKLAAKAPPDYGTLYLCATPIGNLGDISYRAVQTLAKVDLIAAEDTRHTQKLLKYYAIHKPLISYHEHNKAEIGMALLARLKAGENIALVSDAGMPAIADPGEDITRLAIENNIVVRVIPGANAALTALLTAGLAAVPFAFIGFLPRTTKRAKETLDKLAKLEMTLIFYEAPHRLRETLVRLITHFGGERRATISRELTKKFEEHLRGTLVEISKHYASHDARGEYVIIVEGYLERQETPSKDIEPKSIQRLYDEELLLIGDKKEAMRAVAKRLSISRREVYQQILALEEEKGS